MPDLGLAVFLFSLVLSTIAFVFFWVLDRSHIKVTSAAWVVATLVALPLVFAIPGMPMTVGLSIYLSVALGLTLPACVSGAYLLWRKRHPATRKMS